MNDRIQKTDSHVEGLRKHAAPNMLNRPNPTPKMAQPHRLSPNVAKISSDRASVTDNGREIVFFVASNMYTYIEVQYVSLVMAVPSLV